MSDIVVTISGNIGAGKSTLLNNYKSWKGLRDDGEEVIIVPEDVEGNELLRMMYEHPERWTFTSQVNFMIHKFDSYKEALKPRSMMTNSIRLIERAFEDFIVFANIQLRAGSMTRLEYDVYLRLYNTLDEEISNLLRDTSGVKLSRFYLDVPIDLAMERVVKRGRDFEERLCTPTYLYDISRQYHQIVSRGSFQVIPVDYTLEEVDAYFHSRSVSPRRSEFHEYKEVVKVSPIILLTGNQCPNCEMVKRLITEKGLNSRVQYLDAMLEGREFVKSYSITSVPAVIFEGVAYRTFSDIHKLITRGIVV